MKTTVEQRTKMLQAIHDGVSSDEAAEFAGTGNWDNYAMDLTEDYVALETELERERMRLVACGIAAMCPAQLAGMAEEYDSDSRKDVSNMRTELESALAKSEADAAAMREDLTETLSYLETPTGQYFVDKWGLGDSLKSDAGSALLARIELLERALADHQAASAREQKELHDMRQRNRKLERVAEAGRKFKTWPDTPALDELTDALAALDGKGGG